ncbi:MAG: hypothetical protein FJX76_12360 [Armatimonadetes bacterium]|nr:hypothetical protein [Armatimonadota bacterium]
MALTSVPAMVGRGFYNAHSATQANASELARPVLERAARAVPSASPFVMADYGSSQGRNSLAPVRGVLSIARERFGPEIPFCVYHTDLPANDFSALFQVLQSPESYAAENVFSYAVGRTFYDALFPPDTVSIGWTANTVHWLKTIPCTVSGHIWPARGNAEERAAFSAAAQADWTTFMTARAREMRVGARLIVDAGGGDADGRCGAEAALDCLNESLKEHVRPEEHARMVIGGWFRPPSDYPSFFENGWRAPDGQFLKLLSVEHHPLDTAGFDRYLEDHDAHAFALELTATFRAFTETSLVAGLDRSRADKDALMDAVYDGMRRRVEADPRGTVARWDLVVLDIERSE